MKIKRLNFILPMILFLLILEACSSASSINIEQVRKDADPITQNLLTGEKEKDYTKFAKNFNKAMKKEITKGVFNDECEYLRNIIGVFISKEFVSVERGNKILTVIYNVKYTKEPDGVVVKVDFDENNDVYEISGLYYDSPKLREN